MANNRQQTVQGAVPWHTDRLPSESRMCRRNARRDLTTAEHVPMRRPFLSSSPDASSLRSSFHARLQTRRPRAFYASSLLTGIIAGAKAVCLFPGALLSEIFVANDRCDKRECDARSEQLKSAGRVYPQDGLPEGAGVPMNGSDNRAITKRRCARARCRSLLHGEVNCIVGGFHLDQERRCTRAAVVGRNRRSLCIFGRHIDQRNATPSNWRAVTRFVHVRVPE